MIKNLYWLNKEVNRVRLLCRQNKFNCFRLSDLLWEAQQAGSTIVQDKTNGHITITKGGSEFGYISR